MKSGILQALVAGALLIAGPAVAQGAKRAAASTAAVETAATAAAARPAPVDSASAYDSQALRFESRWGSADIKRGVAGRSIGTVGWFRDFDVEQLVSTSPRAATEARTFRAENFHGSLATGVGALTFVTGIVIASNSSNNAASPILIIVGAGGMAWGVQHLQVGYSALTRAFWWYNRDLTR
jgi:hypothetical protein